MAYLVWQINMMIRRCNNIDKLISSLNLSFEKLAFHVRVHTKQKMGSLSIEFIPILLCVGQYMLFTFNSYAYSSGSLSICSFMSSRVETSSLWRWGLLTPQRLDFSLIISFTSCQMKRFILSWCYFLIALCMCFPYFRIFCKATSFVWQPILEAKATAVWLDKNYRPVRIPPEVRSKLTQFMRHETSTWLST